MNGEPHDAVVIIVAGDIDFVDEIRQHYVVIFANKKLIIVRILNNSMPPTGPCSTKNFHQLSQSHSGFGDSDVGDIWMLVISGCR